MVDWGWNWRSSYLIPFCGGNLFKRFNNVYEISKASLYIGIYKHIASDSKSKTFGIVSEFQPPNVHMLGCAMMRA